MKHLPNYLRADLYRIESCSQGPVFGKLECVGSYSVLLKMVNSTPIVVRKRNGNFFLTATVSMNHISLKKAGLDVTCTYVCQPLHDICEYTYNTL